VVAARSRSVVGQALNVEHRETGSGPQVVVAGVEHVVQVVNRARTQQRIGAVRYPETSVDAEDDRAGQINEPASDPSVKRLLQCGGDRGNCIRSAGRRWTMPLGPPPSATRTRVAPAR
jgi:hypothetical protein